MALAIAGGVRLRGQLNCFVVFPRSHAVKNHIVIAMGCVLCLGAAAQQATPSYVIGVSIVTGFPPHGSCPLFIGGVYPHSPAADAGIKAGDRLLTIDGTAVNNLEDASKRMHSSTASPVVVGFARGATHDTATVQRVEYASLLRENGEKEIDGVDMDLNATDAEAGDLVAERKAMEEAFKARDCSIAFPDRHYPVNKKLYYPGFEVFVWDKGQQVTVGGIEHGPAYRSGVRWGDRILAVNGVDPHGKSIAELESLLSSVGPAPMVLTINRAGTKKSFSFDLEQATGVLRDNVLKVVDGHIVPLWTTDEYLPCFEAN